QYRQGGITQDLVFLVGQGLSWRNSDRVTGVHAHRVKVFDRADDDAVVLLIADNLHFVFFPTDQRFVDQQLFGRRQVQTTGADFFELFAVVSDTAAGAAHGEGRTDNAWEAELIENRVGLFHAVGDAGTRTGQADGFHRLVETRTVFSHVRIGHDGGRVGVHQNDAVTLFAQGFTRLGAGVVELAGLADHDRASTENQDAFNVCTFWHG